MTNSRKFEPEILYTIKKENMITCPHCGLNVYTGNIELDVGENAICPHCNNAIKRDHIYRKHYIKTGIESIPIKCLNCNFSFIKSTVDFYYRPGNIKCPKCGIELRRDSVIEVYKQYKLKQENAFTNKHPWLATFIVLGLFFLIIYLIIVIFS